jgi:hypothetical protein
MRDKIRYMQLAGCSAPEIAERLHISISMVHSALAGTGGKDNIRALDELDANRRQECKKRMR